MDVDYEKLEFKAGLEIHQQLDSSKLFCNCPSLLRKDEPDFTVNRKLHAVAGESGEVDIAALYQKSLGKEFEYQGYDTTCLVELDEEPPHEINKDALQIALYISLLLNCKILPITQIMRKAVIDGSNTSGFQRTVLIAKDGYLDTNYGRVGIESIFLEEDAARIIERSDEKEIYRLDRLGIPLVEVVTTPDAKTPEQAKQIALDIGEILRSCKVKRGIGTIRQDVNVSIRGENRVELKGMQDMNIFVKVIENEVVRQKKLSDKKTPVKMEVRGAQKDGATKYMRPLPGAARMYPETDLPILKISRDFINRAKKTLPRLRKEIEKDLVKKGLSQEMIQILFKQNKLIEFGDLIKIVNQPMLVAKSLLIFPNELSKKIGESTKNITEISKKLTASLEPIFIALKKQQIFADQIKEVMENIAKGFGINTALKTEKEDIHVIEEKVRKIIKKKPGLSEKAYMGLVMKEFRGKVSGRDAMEIIKKYVK